MATKNYIQSPALAKHILDSLLPYEYKPYESKPFIKSKQFYKPEKFIWNNPHRASEEMLKYYHAYHQKYQTQKAPKIKQLQNKQRQQKKLQRIKQLSQIKLQTRQRFFTRKSQRENLEVLSGTKKSIGVESDYITTAKKRYSTISHYHSKPANYEPMIPTSMTSKMSMRKSEKLLHIEQTYLTGIQKSINERKKIESMIVRQTHKHQQQLRQEFERQKQTNEQKISRISKFQNSKLDTSLFSKKH